MTPAFSGADKLYTFLLDVTHRLNREEYKAARRRNKGRKLRTFRPSAEADEIIAALGKGDEATIKHLALRYR